MENEALRGELFLARKEILALRAQMEVALKKAEGSSRVNTPRSLTGGPGSAPSSPAPAGELARLRVRVALSQYVHAYFIICMPHDDTVAGRRMCLHAE